jgi:hypothetical protein
MNPVIKYFSAERFYCAIGIGIGVVAILVAICFLVRIKQPFFNGASYPLLIVGLFFLVICTGVYMRSPKDIVRVNAAIANDPTHVKSIELPRMEKVMSNFRVIMIVEVSLVLISAAGLLFFRLAPTWRGALSSLLILSLLLLAFDWLADKRGNEYHQYLKTITK